MVTMEFAPLSVEFARDADATMLRALGEADGFAQQLAAAKATKRDTDAALKDREAELTLHCLSGGAGEKSNAELRKAQIAATLAQDAEMLRLRRALATAQEQIDQAELRWELEMKRWHAARVCLEYSTAVANLYAAGGRLTS